MVPNKLNLLLLSNSTNVGEEYLEYSKPMVREFLKNTHTNIIFIPYAAVTFSYDVYEQKVNEAWKALGISVESIHHFENPIQAIENAKAIIVGGGNTWKLVNVLHRNKLMDIISEKVRLGTPYIGWSAGSNIACPTLKTTNDMPIIDPISFQTLNLIPFQINPHYLDYHPEGFGGETREQRVEEFITENKNIYVVGLREGTLLKLSEDSLKLVGNKSARIFRYGAEPQELTSSDNFDFLF